MKTCASPDAQTDLYLVGLGIGGFDRRSVEVDNLLKSARKVLHLTAFDADLRHLSAGDVVDLEQVYGTGSDPRQVYQEMAMQALLAGVDARGKGHACFLTYGHPLFLVDSGWWIEQAAAEYGITVKAIPAASFLDSLLIDLGARFDRAVQSYEANVFFRYQIQPDTRFPVVPSRFGSFDVGRLRQRDNLYGRLAPLTRRLRDLYPTDRPVAAVLSAWRADMAPQISHTTVGEIDTLASSSHSGMSLYIGGSEEWTRSRQNSIPYPRPA
ncbi:SAM-dependent methyltransferase [Streptomyces melanogenes]|uniref:SAM-dependent methyltransferase n=1 Tax=Streptomyces melanogenes TaxID=67326 RepID=UPI0037B05278